jgi:hypothetical protein
MRFYPGTTIAYWRHEVPVEDINMCLRAIPRLRAEEAMLTSVQTAVGTGSLKKGAARATMARWAREANGGRRRPRVRRPVDPRELAAFGIKVTAQVPQ